MLFKKINQYIYIGILLSLFIAVLSGIALLNIPHLTLLALINKIRPETPFQFFTPEYQSHLNRYLIIFIISILLSILFFLKNKYYFINLVEYILQEIQFYSLKILLAIKKYFHTENKIHILIFLFMLFSCMVIRFIYVDRPVLHDEAKTFYSFISKSWLDVLSNYYIPNNHIFHSICARFFYVILGNEEWVLRIPVIISGILTSLFIYIFAEYYYNKYIALILSAISFNAIPLVSYSVDARGHIMVTLFFLVLLCIIKSINHKESITLWILFIVISTLGIWTVPTMIMPLILLSILYIINLRKYKLLTNLLKFLLAMLGCALLSLIVYSPVILRCGLDSIISNEYVTRSESLGYIISNLPNYTYNILLTSTIGYPDIIKIVILLLFLIGVFYHLSSKENRNLLYAVLLFFIFLLFGLKKMPSIYLLVFIYPVLLTIIASGIYSLTIFLCNNIKVSRNNTVNILSIFLFCLSTLICHNKNGYIAPDNCTQIESIILDIKMGMMTSDIIEASTASCAGSVRYYLKKNGIDVKQLFWYSLNKNKDYLTDYKRIYVIAGTVNGYNNLESFGYSLSSSLDGYTFPKVWGEYDDVIVYVIDKI